MSSKRIPNRLSSRLHLPADCDAHSVPDWEPKRFYDKNPKICRGELIFDPTGSNQSLLDELLTRAKAHSATGAFLVTDVLFIDEINRIVEDWSSIELKLNELRTAPLRHLEEREAEIRWKFYEDSRDLYIRAARAMNKKALQELLTPALLRNIEKSIKDPSKVADLILEIVDSAERMKTSNAARKKNQNYSDARKQALEEAEALWKEDPQLTKRKVAEQIQAHLISVTVKIETIENWIKTALPSTRKQGGRPRKS